VEGAPAAGDLFDPALVTVETVPYLTFPLANRRGTTILDRSTAYPVFGRRAGKRALELVRQGVIDVVHGFGAGVLGYAQARLRAIDTGARAPLVVNPQGLEEFGATAARQTLGKRVGYAPLRAAVRTCARAADAIIATDRALEPVVIRHLQPAAGRVHVIPNGVDLAEADSLAGSRDGAALRSRLGIPPDEVVLLSVGRLEFNKGFDVLAAALGRLAHAGGPLASRAWRWVLIGEGPFKTDIAATIARSGVGAHVHFAGRASEGDLHAWYEAATLFVHPTRYEGSSLVTLEAMSHRRAIVATRAGGLPDKVKPAVNGWLVEPDDVTALAGAIREALSAKDRLPGMGAESRRIVEREFAWPIVAAQHVALYRALTRP
jgi:glycosyltransferase involved in cell wall biosynthesis